MAKVVRDWCAIHVRGRAAEVIFRQLKFYAVVGIGSTVIGLAIIVALHKGAGFGLFAANAIGYGAGYVFSFFANRRWTFAHTGAVARPMLLFAGLALVAFLANYYVTLALVEMGIIYYVAQILGVITYSGLVFLGAKFIVFPEDS